MVRGLYVITHHSHLSPKCCIAQVAQALAGGANMIQYRDKSSDEDKRFYEAMAIKQQCLQYGARLIINDDVQLARQTDAHGVHLGQEDMSLVKARSQLGVQKLIGVSCYADVDRAQAAVRQGADYVAFGRFYPSDTKPDQPQADLEVLTQAKALLSVPIVAIGGVTIDNGSQLLAAGADSLAVSGGVFRQPDIRYAAQRLAALLQSTEKVAFNE